mgnify:CR=1 FL=1
MSLNIKEEVLHVESLVGENSAQAVLQTTLDLSGSAPSIGRIVWIKPTAIVSDAAAAIDKVNLEGYIDLKLVYVAEDFDGEPPNYQVVSYRQAITFSDYVEVIGAEEGMLVQAKAELLGLEWALKSDQRTVDVDVLVQFSARVKKQHCIQAVTNASVKPPKKLAVEEGVFTIQSMLKTATTALSVERELAVETEDQIKFVLNAQVKPRIEATQVEQNQITLSGNLDLHLIYLNEESHIQSWAYPRAFPFTVSVPNDTKTAEIAVRPEVMADLKVDANLANNSFSLAGDLRFKLDLYESKQIRIVNALTGSGGLVVESRTETVMLDNVVNEKSQQAAAQGVIELTSNYPPIREIVVSEGKVVNVDYRVDDDKVFVEGAISIDVTYLAHTEDEHKPLYRASFSNAVPFQQVIAIGGVQPGMVAELDIDVVQINLDLINRETIEADITYRSQLKVIEPVQRDIVVEAVEVPPLEEDPPTITYVFVHETDTLWKLSRQYHTSLEAILEANSWLREREPMRLLPGDKLCIPRKTLTA